MPVFSPSDMLSSVTLFSDFILVHMPLLHIYYFVCDFCIATINTGKFVF
jgi:hypothetical protein